MFHKKKREKTIGKLELPVQNSNSAWWFPTSMKELEEILSLRKNIQFAGGHTEIFANDFHQGDVNIVHLSRIPELRAVEMTSEDAQVGGVLLGASLTISEMIFHLEKLIEIMPGLY